MVTTAAATQQKTLDDAPLIVPVATDLVALHRPGADHISQAAVTALAATISPLVLGMIDLRSYGVLHGLPTPEAGADIAAAIVANGRGRYYLGEGYDYKVSTRVPIAVDGVEFVGRSFFILGAADIFMFYVTGQRARFDGQTFRNTSSYGHTNRLVFSTSAAVYIDGYGQADVTNVDIENFVIGILHLGGGPGTVSTPSRFIGVRVSVMPWSMANAAFTASIAATLMTVTAIASGAIATGYNIYGTGVTNVVDATQVNSLGTGTGGTGTYNLNQSQTVASQSITEYATWANDGICISNYATGDVVDTCTVVVFGGTYGAFNNLTGVTYTYARCGITVDLGCISVKVRNSIVGEGFAAAAYNDGNNRGTEFDACTFYGGYYSTVTACSATLRGCRVYASARTQDSVVQGVILLSGGGRLIDNDIAGGSALIPLVRLLNVLTLRVVSRGNHFSGTYLSGFSGNTLAGFLSNGDDWAGTCADYLYRVTNPAAYSVCIEAMTQSALTFKGGIVGNALNNLTIIGCALGGYTEAALVLLGGSTNIRVANSDLSCASALLNAILVSNGSTVPKMAITGNNLAGPTTAFAINTAAASIGTSANDTTHAQVVTGNINNTTGTF